MPIANLFMRKTMADRLVTGGDLIARWASAANLAADHMTVNVVTCDQFGAPYAVMAFLYLPTLWTDDQVNALQLGLASALTTALGVPPQSVQVVVTMVPSGHACEGGTIARWEDR